jgi:hypothetical protein
MAGGRLAVEHLEAVILDSGVREIHLGSAASRPVEGQESGSTGPDGGPPWTRTDARLVKAVVDLISGLGSGKK